MCVGVASVREDCGCPLKGEITWPVLVGLCLLWQGWRPGEKWGVGRGCGFRRVASAAWLGVLAAQPLFGQGSGEVLRGWPGGT